MYHPRLCESLLCDTPAARAPLGVLADEVYRTALLPNAREEEWKFTSLQALEGQKIQPSKAITAPQIEAAEQARLVFVNGIFNKALSASADELAAQGVQLQACAYDKESEGYRGFFEHLPLSALSAHSAVSPLDITLADKGKADLQLLFIGDNHGDMTHHGHFIRLHVGKEAELNLFEQHLSGAGGDYVHHDYLRIDMQKGAQLTHHKLQLAEATAHLGHAHVRLLGSARYVYGALNLGSRLARQDLHVHLDAPQAEAEVQALLLPLAGQTQHLSTAIKHHSGDCQSRQQVKIIAADKACATYQGRVHIAEGAMGSVGHQHSRGLLLDSTSEINNKPELEIFADAVECAHGSAVGALEEEPLFYLQSRGLTEARAYDLLLRAYVEEVAEAFASAPYYEKFSHPLAERMGDYADYLQRVRKA